MGGRRGAGRANRNHAEREREGQRCDLCFSQFAILITFSLLGGSVKSIPAAYAFYPLYSSSVGETKATCEPLLA